jgi:hypothetical protein
MTTGLVDDEEIPEETVELGQPQVVVPSIPDSARTDKPPEGASNDLVNTPPDPQGDHTRWMDKLKLTFAVRVVVGSFVVVVGLSVTQFLTQNDLPESTSLDDAIEWSKSIATIAIGFALGRTISEGKNEPK